MHSIDKTLRQGGNRLTILNRTIDDLVVNIGDITDVNDLITTGSQPAHHHIKHNHHPGMANMTKVIDRHSTDIHLHLARLDGFKGLFRTTESVIDLQHRGYKGGQVAPIC